MLVIHGFYVEIFTEADQYLYVCVYVMHGDSHTFSHLSAEWNGLLTNWW